MANYPSFSFLSGALPRGIENIFCEIGIVASMLPARGYKTNCWHFNPL